MRSRNNNRPFYRRFTLIQLCLGICVGGLSACGVYSFSGVNTTAETIYVGNFLNRASGGPPSLGQNFTEQLKEYYQRNSPLSIAERDGDLTVTGNIVRYEVSPIAAGGNDQANQNRLTIAVEVDFVNLKEDDKDFTQTFSFYADFPPEQTITQVENVLIDEIYEQIILDIFNKTVADW